jgi:hypothetical protein
VTSDDLALIAHDDGFGVSRTNVEAQGVDRHKCSMNRTSSIGDIKTQNFFLTRTGRNQKSKSKAHAKTQRRKEYTKFFLCFSLRHLSGFA